MTTFAEMEALVVGQTRRSEVPAITQAAIRTATLRAHHTDFFPRDLTMGQLDYAPSSTSYSYDFANVQNFFPRLRAFQLMQSVDPIALVPVEELEFRDIDDLYTAEGEMRMHVYTMIGDTLRLYPSAPTGKFSAYYFRNPVTQASGYSSWIADEYPDELAMWAAAIVWARTGFADMATDAQRTHVQPFKELLISSHLFTTGN